MKYNKILFIITLITSIITFVLCLIFTLCSCLYNSICQQLFCGVFCSALLVFATSIVGYNVEKQNAITNIINIRQNCNLGRIIYCNEKCQKQGKIFEIADVQIKSILTLLNDNLYLLKNALTSFKNGCFKSDVKSELSEIIIIIEKQEVEIYNNVTSRENCKSFSEIFEDNNLILSKVLKWIQSQREDVKTFNNP